MWINKKKYLQIMNDNKAMSVRSNIQNSTMRMYISTIKELNTHIERLNNTSTSQIEEINKLRKQVPLRTRLLDYDFGCLKLFAYSEYGICSIGENELDKAALINDILYVDKELNKLKV